MPDKFKSSRFGAPTKLTYRSGLFYPCILKVFKLGQEVIVILSKLLITLELPIYTASILVKLSQLPINTVLTLAGIIRLFSLGQSLKSIVSN